MIRVTTYYSDNDRRSSTVVEEDGRFCAVCVEYDRRCLRAEDFIKGANTTSSRCYDTLATCSDYAENWVMYKD